MRKKELRAVWRSVTGWVHIPRSNWRRRTLLFHQNEVGDLLIRITTTLGLKPDTEHGIPFSSPVFNPYRYMILSYCDIYDVACPAHGDPLAALHNVLQEIKARLEALNESGPETETEPETTPTTA